MIVTHRSVSLVISLAARAPTLRRPCPSPMIPFPTTASAARPMAARGSANMACLSYFCLIFLSLKISYDSLIRSHSSRTSSRLLLQRSDTPDEKSSYRDRSHACHKAKPTIFPAKYLDAERHQGDISSRVQCRPFEYPIARHHVIPSRFDKDPPTPLHRYRTRQEGNFWILFCENPLR